MPFVLAVAVVVALLAAGSAQAQGSPPPPPPAAVDQYTETPPTASGSVKKGKAKPRGQLPVAVRAQAGSRAATLEQIGSSADNAPSDRTSKSRPRAKKTNSQPQQVKPASALQKPSLGTAVSGSGGAFSTLLVVLLGVAAALVAAAVAFRLRRPQST